MKTKRDAQFNYNVMDSHQSFFYVMLINVCSPLAFTIAVVGLNLLKLAGIPEPIYNFALQLLQVLFIPSLFLLFIITYHKKQNINLKTATNFEWKVNPVIVIVCIAILAVCITSFFPIINMMYSALEAVGFNVSGGVAFQMNNWWQLLIGVFVYCALPAIAEEIIFRGMMLKGYLSKLKPIVAITISSIAFFIMHGSLIQSFYQIVLGFLLGFVAYYTKNIFYPIIFHFLNNLIVILINYFGIGGFLNGFSLSVGGIFLGVGIAIVGASIIFFLFLLLKHLMKKKNSDYEFVVDENNIILEEKTEKVSFKQLITTMTMDESFYFYGAWIVAIVVWIFNSI